MEQVTFVIATYQRADALRCTLEALRLQDHEAWDAVVVGDNCEEETESTIRSIGDPRIAYYNLPRRCGEQSGPNSFGLALASGDLVTFLNHDDLLLPDHLSYGIECMMETNADFFIGMAANATRLAGADPVFTDILPRSTDLRRLLIPPLYTFDPSSFWLVRTTYAHRVGSWKPARTLWRTPLDDWLIRAWQFDGTFAFGQQITGLRVRTHYLHSGSPLYDKRSPEAEALLERLRDETPEELRAHLLAQIREFDGEMRPETNLRRRKALAWLFKTIGFDTVALLNRLRGGKGSVLRRITKKRTGRDLPEPPDIEDLVAEAPSFRVY